MAILYFQYRHEVDELFPKGRVGAEIGVDKGQHAVDLLNITRPSKIYLVDRWDYEAGLGTQESLAIAKEAVSKLDNASVAEFVVSRGVPWLVSLPESYLDWCYLDTTHEYEDTVQELAAMRRAVRIGGHVAGHDFTLGGSPDWKAGVARAVIEAIEEGWLRLEGLSDERFSTWVGRRVK